MLRRTSAEVECAVAGASMSPSIPDGATVRIRLDGAVSASEPGVVALLLAGDTLTIHRLVGRGRSARTRGYVMTHGDGNVFCDAPQLEADLLGTVLAVQAERGGPWCPVAPPVRAGLRGAVTLAFEMAMTVALELSPRCGIALRNLLVLMLTPWMWLRPPKPGTQRATSRLVPLPSGPAS